MENNKFFGYYSDAFQEKPEYDPGIKEGLCLICAKNINHPMKTISLMSISNEDLINANLNNGEIKSNSERSYFYRVHKKCKEEISEEELCDLEISILKK